MDNKQSKIIVRIFAIIISIVLFIIFINDYGISQYSKRLNTAIEKNDVETARNILNQCPESVNSLPTIMPYFIRKIMEVPEISYPLQKACTWENYEMVRLLVENGANVNCVSPGMWSSAPPLASLVKVHEQLPWMEKSKPIDEEDLNIIIFLLENGADKSIKDYFGKTAYDYAVELGETDLEELLKY